MPSAAVPNVPAWKRLGLKLKSAQSTSEVTPESLDSTKRKRSEETQDNTPSKKSKKLSALNAPTPITPIASRLLERKKSVTFTPETKHEDGDSIKQLFNSWVSEQKSQDPSFDFKSSGPAFQVPEPPKVEEVVDTTLDEKERKVKRVKQPKKEKIPNKPGIKSSKITKPAITSARPFLQYLRQYSESKETWKFNKNHQNHFIRSIFNLEAIPSDHAHFIYPYIHGLQGLVRTRLRDTALALKVKDEEEGFPVDMPNRDQKTAEYEAAKSNYIAEMKAARLTELGYEEGVLHNLSDNVMRQRVASRIRAEQVLHELGSPPPVYAEDEATETRQANGKVARKRKQRTTYKGYSSSSDDSSEDDSESESSSADTSDDSGPGPKVRRAAGGNRDDRDNSDNFSSSSSSSSDAEMRDANDGSSESSESSDSSGSSDDSESDSE